MALLGARDRTQDRRREQMPAYDGPPPLPTPPPASLETLLPAHLRCPSAPSPSPPTHTRTDLANVHYAYVLYSTYASPQQRVNSYFCYYFPSSRFIPHSLHVSSHQTTTTSPSLEYDAVSNIISSIARLLQLRTLFGSFPFCLCSRRTNHINITASCPAAGVNPLHPLFPFFPLRTPPNSSREGSVKFNSSITSKHTSFGSSIPIL